MGLHARLRSPADRPGRGGGAFCPIPASSMLAVLALSVGLGLAAYAGAVEPFRLVLRRSVVRLPGWDQAPLRIGVLADIHAALPLMPASRVAAIARQLVDL